MYRPSGVLTSMVTSFAADGSVDERGLRANIEFQRREGITTVVVLGGTGEPMSMTPAERERVMAVSIEAGGAGMRVVVAALVGNPDEVGNDIAAAARHGASGCMITTPPFVRPSESDVYEFVSRTAARSKVPLIIFNVPSRTGYLMSPALVARIAANIDVVVGIKESSRDIVQFGEIRMRCPEPFACLQGVDSLFLPSLALGGNGGILAAAAVFPEYCQAIDQGMAAGDLPRAREKHFQLLALTNLLFEASHPAPLKVAIETRGLPVGRTRPPLYGISNDLSQRVVACTKQLEAQTETASLA